MRVTWYDPCGLVLRAPFVGAGVMIAASRARGCGSSTRPGPRRHFEEPTVEGVGYPILGISQAWNDANEGVLHVTSYAATPSRRGTPTRPFA